MHIQISRLDMIVLLTLPECLNETQQNQIQKVLRANKALFDDTQCQNQQYIKQLYVHRFPRLEQTLQLDLNVEQIYDLCTKQYLKDIKKSGTQGQKIYQYIIETHRLQSLYMLKEPSQQQQHYNCIDYEIDENNKMLLLSNLYTRNRLDESRLIFNNDLLRRRMNQMIKEITDRNQSIQRGINSYNYFQRKKSCYTPTPMRSRNNTFYKIKPQGLRVYTEFVIEKKLPTRSIYQMRKIQLMDENIDIMTPICRNSCKALGRPRSLIRTKFINN